MILVGIGSNLAAPGFGSPQETAKAALTHLPTIGLHVVRSSRWYLSAPVPASDQPWYVNAVALIETSLSPAALLAALLALEARFSRRRSARNAVRTLDLDLLDYEGRQSVTRRLVLPHPRLHERRFVLGPLAEIAPQWRHPLLGMSAKELMRHLPAGQPIRAIDEEGTPCR